jgi:hypothetical protein
LHLSAWPWMRSRVSGYRLAGYRVLDVDLPEFGFT